ncbi:NAD(P)-binding protein [Periconia macrospinosa]|uniref:NAD(P)-binding protein n=1 Tax=Periconia macrospinosa TaxID=97972 RepID=A0A2V1DCC5_9PLEO|nr:NAD(P)-binding protein [Periconia macrospinosa]
MQPPLPSPVPTWRNDIYPAIDPTTNPSLHQPGKTIIITGAGTGIGRTTSLAFAAAKASHIILMGRTQATLDETATLIKQKYPSTKTTIFAGSVTDATRIASLAELISSMPTTNGGGPGKWDTLILNAATLGPMSDPTSPCDSTILSVDVPSLLSVFETNTLSIVLFLQHLLPHAAPLATVVNVGSASGNLPARLSPGFGAYVASKAAGEKVVEEGKEGGGGVFITTIQPGVVPTQLFAAAGLKEGDLPMDTAELPAGFMVWLARKGGEMGGEGERVRRALGGRFVSANWDVGDVVERLCGEEGGWGEEKSNEGTLGLLGFPWGMSLGM